MKLKNTLMCSGSRLVSVARSMLIAFVLISSLLFSESSNAQITVRSSSSIQTTTATASIPKPVGLVVGDLMLAQILQSGNDNNDLSNAGFPVGWTLAASTNMNNGNSRYRANIFYKTAVAADVAASTFSFTGDSDSEDMQGAIIAFIGVDVSNIFDPAPGNYAISSGDNSLSPTSITTTYANSAVVFFGILRDNINVGTYTSTNPASYTELYDLPYNVNEDMGMSAAWAIRTTAGATGTGNGTLASSVGNGAIFIGLKRCSATAVAGNAVTTCASNPVNITSGSSASNFASFVWTHNGTGTIANANSLTLATYTAGPGESGNVTLTLTATANAPCASASSTKILTIAAQPTASAGGSVETCQNTPVLVAGATSSNGTILWTHNGTGSLANANTNAPTYTPAIGDNGNDVTLTMTVSNAPCVAASANYTISVVGAPTSVAGTAVSTCGSNPVNITAGSSSSNNAGITWTHNGTGSIANDDSLTNAIYTPGPGESGNVTLTLTATGNAPCADAVSTKTLTVSAQPTASAGGSVETCQNTPVLVAGATSSNGTILWTHNGTGSLANANTNAPTYTPAVGDNGNDVILTMTVSNAPCVAATANYTISVIGTPTAVAGSAVTSCVNASVNITAGSSATNNAGITWSHNGTGSISDDDSLTLATYNPGLNETGVVTITLTATGNAPCADVVSNKTLTISAQPTASAGGSATICFNQTALVAGASSTNGTILWTHNGGGSLANATTNAPTYTPGGGDGGNAVTLTMTVSNAPCANATATYTVNVIAAPIAVAGTPVAVCTNDSTNITAGSSASNNTGVLWTHNGTGSIADANSLTSAVYTPGPGEVGNVTLTLTSNGNAPCANATSTKTLTINPIPSTIGVVICAGQSGALTAVACAPGAPLSSTKFAGAGATGGTGTVWLNPGNIISNNDVRATVAGSTSGNIVSQTLTSSSFGFAIPANATILGVECKIGRNRSGGLSGEVQDASLRLLKAGVATGTNKAATSTNWPGSEAEAVYGAANDLWGSSWTPADLNAGNFGVAFVIDISQGFLAARTANVDYITLVVTYTVPGTLSWFTTSSGGSAIGTGISFNPVGVAGSGLADTNTAGVTTYYAECAALPGCRTPTTFTINALPVVSFTGLGTSYCGTTASIALTGNQAPNGSFTGAGIIDNGNGTATFNPASAGAGVHAIVYSYTDGNTCLNTDSQNVTVIAPTTYYADVDGDGFGNAAVTELSCDGPSVGYVADNTDCNDNQIQYLDSDADGFGSSTQVACGVANNTDCNDAVLNYADLDGDGFGSDTFVDCGGSLNSDDCDDTVLNYADLDGDGFGSDTFVACGGVLNTDDCDDAVLNYSDVDGDGFGSDTFVACDGVLNSDDCDDTVLNYADLDGDGFGSDTFVACLGVLNTDDCDDTAILYLDADGDGFGTTTQVACGVTNNTDCDDNDDTKNASFPFYADADGDTYGAGDLVSVCAVDAVTPPTNYSLNNTDCNDSNIAIFTSGPLFIDGDNDGYTTGATEIVCYGLTAPSGYALTNIGIDCNDALAAINPGQTEVLYNGVDDNCDGNLDEGFQYVTQVQAGQCGTTLTTINSFIVANSIPQVTQHLFEITDVETSEVQTLMRYQNYFSPTMLSSYNYARTYSVRVQIQRNGVWLGYYGPSCLVSTPAVLVAGGAATINPSQCGQTIPTISTLIATTSLPNVTGYKFRITNGTDPLAPNQVQIIDRGPFNWFALTMLSTFNYGTTYLVEVSLKTNGTYSPFGSPCAVSSPAAPTLTNCDVVIPTKGALIATASLNRVTSYRFEITNLLTNSLTTLDRSQNWFTFNNVPTYVAGGEYGVRVSVMTSGNYSPFGEGCFITAPATAREVEATNEFDATVYPNPFAENFTINVTTASEENFMLKVYDMTGRMIESRELTLLDMQSLKIGDRYPSGVYNVILTQGGNVETLRVIKR